MTQVEQTNARGSESMAQTGCSLESTQRPLRVLQFISTLQLGGAAKGTVELVHALEQRDDIEVRLCALGNTHSPVEVSQLRNTPIDLCCPVSLRRLTLRRWRRIRRVVRDFQPDIIHSHLWPTAREVAWATSGLRLPHLVHIRDTPRAFAENRWQSRIKKQWLRYSLSSRLTLFVAVSDAARDYAIRNLGLPPDRVSVVVNGVDIAPFTEIARRRTSKPSGEVVIGTAARLSPSKGVADLVEAFRQLALSGRNVRLRIAGEGDERSALEEQCREFGIDSRVTFLGGIESMPMFLLSLDVFAFTSLAEGLPRVLLEAMASGIPVVTTDCEGVENIGSLAQCGAIVPRGDTSAMAAAIESLIQDPEKRIRCGKIASTAVERGHSIERVCNEVMEAYRRLVPQFGQGDSDRTGNADH